MVIQQAPPGPRPYRPSRPGRALRGSAAAGAALALALSAMPAPVHADEGDAGGGDTLTIGIGQQVDSFSPFLAQLALTTRIHSLTYPTLTTYDPETMEPAPELAESWDTSDDGLTWTFDIRDGVEWTDGEPVTAEDVAWTFSTMMEDSAAATAGGNYVEGFEEVTAEDDSTVRIELEEPRSTMLALNVPILPEHIWAEIDDYGEYNNDEEFPVVGSGPFVLTGYEPNRSITLEANEDHWRGAPGFDTLVFRYYPDKDGMVEALRNGELSFIEGLTPAQADALEGEDGVAVNNATGNRFQAFTINPGAETQDGEEFGDGHPSLADTTLRQAIVRAIDKEELVGKVYGGYADPATGYIPSRFEDYTWAPDDGESLDFDPDAANEMLDEAGYEMGDDGVRESPDGDRLELRMHVHNDRPDYVQVGQFMEEWLAEIGIEVQGEYVDPGVLSDALYDAEYDLIFTGWQVNPDPDYVLSLHTCDALPETPGSMRGDAYFCNEEYDELYERQFSEYEDADARKETIGEMQRILYDEAVVNTLTYPNALEAYRTDQIADIQTQPAEGGLIWGQDGYWAWWSAEPAQGGSGLRIPAGAAAGIGAAVVLLAAGAGFLLWRRRAATAGDRE
ncbi:ABC transporter substrate-binding protein [Allosalinactinospora lopnorensis]|uniref:ABC transporter substrate-binding protein n=1 Tax=Allosalinactinospora lopnorensis TaxID=1352348 RepID=UPI000623E2A5|nr:ABC transporter substrate-binding protein [Allosalinactinospora lopnorensis]